MAEPDIVEVQEHIIEMDGVRYHLEKLRESDFKRTPHQPWCEHCQGHELAPRDDEDRYRIFDHYCHGWARPLLCNPDEGIVYRRMDTHNATGQGRSEATYPAPDCSTGGQYGND